MIKTQGLTHIQLAVADLKWSIEFYTNVFEMEVRFWDGPSMVFLNTPGSADTITLRQAEDGESVGSTGGIAHFGFRLQNEEDREAAVQEVLGAGGSLVEQGRACPGTSLCLRCRSRRIRHRAVTCSEPMGHRGT